MTAEETLRKMPNKYRPERIELKTPHDFADEIEVALKQYLHNRARLERDNEGERVVFSFWPTKSEYFLISMILTGLEYRKKKEVADA